MSKHNNEAVINKIHCIILELDRMVSTKSTKELSDLAQCARIDLDVLQQLLFLDLKSNEGKEHE